MSITPSLFKSGIPSIVILCSFTTGRVIVMTVSLEVFVWILSWVAEEGITLRSSDDKDGMMLLWYFSSWYPS
jgi:hypothetical protein